MLRKIAALSVLPLLMFASPAAAVTNTEKAETCKFGADDQKLTGAKRAKFIKDCMANRNDKRGPVAAKPAAKKKTVAKKPPAAAVPANAAPPPPKQ